MSGFLNNPSTLVPFIKGELIRALNSEPQDALGSFVQTVNSTQRFEDFGVVGQAPVLREVIGDPQTEGLTDATLRVQPAIFTTDMTVKQEDIEDGQLGALMQRIRDVAAGAWRQRRGEIFRALIANGTWIDGAAYFADARPARGRGAAYDNNLAGTGTTTANIIADLATGLSTLRRMQDEQGLPFNEDLTRIGIVAPPELETPLAQALQSGQVSGTNQIFTSLRNWTVVTDARLTDANDWYMFNLGHSQKPFLFVDRVGLEMVDKYEKFVWSFTFRARNRASLVHPQLGVRIVN